jgi:transposase
MLTLHMTPADLEVAKIESNSHIVPKIRFRMMALRMMALDCPRQEVARLLGTSCKTLARLIKMYDRCGLEGVRQLKYRKPKSDLVMHQSSIESNFRAHPPRTGKEAAARIEELTGIKLSSGRVLAFMKSIGMKCLKMGHIPAKADSAKQRTFHSDRLQPLVEMAKMGACHLFYMDASHFTLSPFVCMVWCFNRVFIKAAAGRNRINVLGAINAVTHRLEHVINTTYITATEVVELLDILAQQYAGLPIYVVLDNARYQHCALVMEHAKKLQIQLVFLPAYSPNLNIIERLWKFLREKILHGKYYAEAKAFHAAIRGGVQSVNTDPEWKTQIASRLSENIQFFDDQTVLV